MRIQFWFDFGSPYSYLTAVRIERLTQQAGLALEWRPFLLGPIFRKQGWETSPFNLYPAKGRYMWRDLERTSEAMGLACRKPTVFPQNGLLAARVACWFADAEWVTDFVKRAFAASFVSNLDLSEPAVIENVLDDLGLSGKEILAIAQSQESKGRLRAQTDNAMAYGIFGAPTFRVGDELFWGNDRLEDAIQWAVSVRLKTG
jgi:2-hydroxychromene-2-carboxylate isomerase